MSSENIIGLSFYGMRANFKNVFGITFAIPNGVTLDPDRQRIELCMPYELQMELNRNQYSMDAKEELYRTLIRNTVPDLTAYFEEMIADYGPNPVLLGAHRDPFQCHRSILAKIIEEETPFTAREVTAQYQLYGIDVKAILNRGLKQPIV